MYYERTPAGWEAKHDKSVLFNGSTYPVPLAPNAFWGGDRLRAASVPGYNPATEKLVGPQDLGDGFVGFIVEPLPAGELAAQFDAVKQSYTATIQQHITATAQSRGFDSVDSAAKYAGRKNKKWSDEAVLLIDWTIDVWEESNRILAEVEAGRTPVPTVEEIIEMLPIINWG